MLVITQAFTKKIPHTTWYNKTIMVTSNTLFKKQSGEKASEIATRCLVAIIILNIIMAFIAVLIPDYSFTLVKLYGSFALFLLPVLITVGNLRYIEQYSTTIKVFSWISIASSILAVLLGVVYIWGGGNTFAITNTYNTPSSDYPTDSMIEDRSSQYLTEEYDDSYDIYDDDYDYDSEYDYDYDSDYNLYNDYDDDNYNYVTTTYNPSYTTGGANITNYIPATLKIYLVSSVVMLSAFFIASCLKYKNYSTPIVGLKIASTVCISYCCLVAVSFLLFPVTFNEMAIRFAILALVLVNAGFYSWLALAILAYNAKRKPSINTIENPQNNTPTAPEPIPSSDPSLEPEPTLNDAQTTTETIPDDNIQPTPEA